MRRLLIAAGLALATTLATALAVPTPGLAQQSEPKAPEEMAREGVELLLRALRGFVEAVPQYGLPRIEENGDIVIPRLRRDEQPDAPATDKPEPGETRS